MKSTLNITRLKNTVIFKLLDALILPVEGYGSLKLGFSKLFEVKPKAHTHSCKVLQRIRSRNSIFPA